MKHQTKHKTVTVLSCRSRMTAPEWHAFKLASALGMVATKPTPKARDIIPNEVWEVARRMPDIDWKRDATHLAEARQLVTQLKRISYAET